MRQAVVTAALWANRPLVGAARIAGRLVMNWLDRRRDRIDNAQ